VSWGLAAALNPSIHSRKHLDSNLAKRPGDRCRYAIAVYGGQIQRNRLGEALRARFKIVYAASESDAG
jgi:hypothetical protein